MSHHFFDGEKRGYIPPILTLRHVNTLFFTQSLLPEHHFKTLELQCPGVVIKINMVWAISNKSEFHQTLNSWNSVKNSPPSSLFMCLSCSQIEEGMKANQLHHETRKIFNA